MDRQTTSPAETAPPSLEELFARYLANTESPSPASRPGLVEPYDSGVSHPTDALLAWQGALASLAGLTQCDSLERFPEWATLVQEHESCPAVAMAAGNYPQLMRDLPSLLQAENLADLLETPPIEHDLSSLSTWAARTGKQSFAGRVLAAGVLRLAGHFDEAKEFLRDGQKHSDRELPILQNERAALAWHSGDRESAIRTWATMPVSAASQFNLGMAKLFEKPSDALPRLQAAIKMLVDEDPWRHLAGIYLALAEMRA